ncbi:MAG TPA: glycosyltransferase family 2 protein [bacterium]|nr:glycosyltransferase family 2 protein [bacterium]
MHESIDQKNNHPGPGRDFMSAMADAADPTESVTPDISVILVNWNTRDLLRACLKSIFAQTPSLSCEVTVVDNASEDGSADMVQKEFPAVRLIQNTENSGFGRANNQGFRESSGAYVLFLNPDTEIRDRAIEKAVAFMETHPNVWLAGAKSVHHDGTIQVSTAYFPSLAMIWTNGVPLKIALSVFGPLRRLLKTSAEYSDEGFTMTGNSESRRVDYVLGQFMLTRRDVLEKTGLFDESIFMYEEEADLCYRIHKAGGEVWYVPEAVILHHERRSIDQLPDAFRHEVDWFLSARGRFMEKHHGKAMEVIFHAMTGFSSAVKLVLYAVLFLADRGKRRYLTRRLRYHGAIERWYLKRMFTFIKIKKR